MNKLRALLAVPENHPQGWWFVGLVLTGLCGIAGAVMTETWWLLSAPAAVLLCMTALFDLKRVYFLMIALIPLSIEMELPGGFATDLGSEQLMWLLTLAGGLWFLKNWATVDGRFLKHPLTLALGAHLAWIAVSVAASQDFIVSFKFFLAKGWYVIVFYGLSARFLEEIEDFKSLIWWFFIPLLIAVSIVLVRHAAIDFSFQDVAYVMGPFFRNHVMYACVLAIFIPFLWFASFWYKRYSTAWWLIVIGILVFLTGINFAYTRAAYIALLGAVGVYWAIRFRLIKFALVGALILFALFYQFVSSKDNWLLFAPQYEKAITHTRFENLIEATTRLEDISTMERVYRWVAATYMIKEKPLTGFGPGNFYFYYPKYTVSSFKTYVSDNPERSGIHNYYLMTTVDQGIPGLVIFVAFCFLVMIYGEKVYHQTREKPRRQFLMASVLCFILIALLMLMNDFVETDKIGSFFFICAAVIANTDLYNRREKT